MSFNDEVRYFILATVSFAYRIKTLVQVRESLLDLQLKINRDAAFLADIRERYHLERSQENPLEEMSKRAEETLLNVEGLMVGYF